MAEVRTFRSLTVKMMAVVFAAGIVALLAGVGCYLSSAALVQRFYFSEAAVEHRMTREIESFREYVAQNQIASTDVVAVEQWNREHRYTQLTIQGLETTISSNYHGAELIGTDSGLLIRSGQVASQGMQFAVNFSDGSRGVLIYESSETVILDVAKIGSIVLGALVFLMIVLVYERQLTQAVLTLSRQVTQVSRGDLDRKILSERCDELGQLAVDVDTMRLSIIEKLQREEAAWQANSQLITAISHDVRTPLTALMGYLEIMDNESVSPEERQVYLQVCKNNAQRLKGLTDELFGFFLVFGKPEPDLSLERLDAVTLLGQILLEHEAQLRQQGFDVRAVREGEPGGDVQVDVGHIRRVFDNLFSNVKKYADPERPVGILLQADGGMLRLTVSNGIPERKVRVESNGIGLKTCKKLLSAMGGEFHQSVSEDTFAAEVVLPLYESQAQITV